MKKKIALLLAVCLVGALLFTACQPASEDSGATYTDDGAPVTLKWMLVGAGKQPLSDEVWAEFNKQLEQYLPNTKVEFEVVSFGDYLQKWNLAKTSNEQIDIAWAGWFTPFMDDVTAGTYIPLNDILNKECKELKASMPEWVWQKTTVQDKIYAVPNYQLMNDVRTGLQYYKDTANLVDVEKWTELYAKYPTMNAEQWQMWDEQFKIFKDAGKLRKGFGMEGNLPIKGYETIAGTALISRDSDDLKVVDQMTLEGQLTYNDAVRRWNEAGYVMPGIQSMTSTQREDIEKSATESFSLQTTQYYDKETGRQESRSKQVRHDIEFLPLESYFYITASPAATMTCITRTSANPVRALKLLQLINSEKGKDLYNTLVFGIEGKSYTKLADGRIEGIGWEGGATADSPYGLNNWTVGNVFNGFIVSPESLSWNDYVQNTMHAKAKISPANGFSFNQEPVKAEVANIQAVKDEYLDIFRWGAYADYQQRWQDYQNKLDAAGKQKVLTEVQNQLNAFKEAKK